MTQTSISQNFLDSQHKRVINRIGTEQPTKKWILLAKKYISNILSITFLLLSIIIFIWFINNLIGNGAFLRPSLADVSGIEWVWSPELLGLAVLFYFVSISLQKSLNDSLFKFIGLGTMVAFAMFINIAFYTPTTLAFQSNIQPSFNSLSYRQFSRDYHIKILMEKDIYYGVVIAQNGNSLEIDHGGVVKTFILNFKVADLLNKPIKVEFEKQNNISTILKLEVL